MSLPSLGVTGTPLPLLEPPVELPGELDANGLGGTIEPLLNDFICESGIMDTKLCAFCCLDEDMEGGTRDDLTEEDVDTGVVATLIGLGFTLGARDDLLLAENGWCGGIWEMSVDEGEGCFLRGEG
jgi:hypothetical protein